MEPLVAVSLTGNILQFVHTTRKIIGNTREVSRLGAKEEHVELATIVTELLGLVACTTPPDVRGSSQMNKEEASLRALCVQCSHVADKLLGDPWKAGCKAQGGEAFRERLPGSLERVEEI